MSNPLSPHLRLAVILIGAFAAAAAQADASRDTDAIATREEVSTSAGHNIPAGAFGFLLVERPREVNLLALRGIAGSGKAILRTDQPGLCLTIPVRFVAGDFGGEFNKWTPGCPDPLCYQKQAGRQIVGERLGYRQRHVQHQRRHGSRCRHCAPIRTGRGFWFCHQPGSQHPWGHLWGESTPRFLPACLAAEIGAQAVAIRLRLWP